MIKKWLFINYCLQRIGMWDRNRLNEGVNHVFKLQLYILFSPIPIVLHHVFISKIFNSIIVVFVVHMLIIQFGSRKTNKKMEK